MKQRDTGISRAGLEGVGTGSLLLERGLSLWESGEQPVRGERRRDSDSSSSQRTPGCSNCMAPPLGTEDFPGDHLEEELTITNKLKFQSLWFR